MESMASANIPALDHRYELETGVLQLSLSSSRGRELFRVAERINPKRAFLFVSTVLGRHIPVDPVEHRAALHELANGVANKLLPGPVFVMGFAETAVGIGAGVFDCLRKIHRGHDLGYLTTTRFSPADVQDWFTIEETHSHAVDHIILEPREGVLQYGRNATLILVDDETTTGKTFAKLASGLRSKGLTFGRVILVTLTDWANGQAEAATRGIFPGAEVMSVSLQKGSWQWTPKQDREPLALPDGCFASRPPWKPQARQIFASPRTGLSSSDVGRSGEDILEDLQSRGFQLPDIDDRVLVVGAGEHVWQPMLAAEVLCRLGVYTRFITTTRSPILVGKTIRQKVSFPDHYGCGFWMYLHNVDPEEWDRIIFFTETDSNELPIELLEWFGTVEVIDGGGNVSTKSVETAERVAT